MLVSFRGKIMEIRDIFFQMGRVRPTADEKETVQAIGREEVMHRYAETFHDELERQDAKLYRSAQPDFGVDPRRRKELADGGMVREDRKAMSNLSNQAIHHEYPRLGYYTTPYVDAITRAKTRKGTK